jgi:TnpA family transposase
LPVFNIHTPFETLFQSSVHLRGRRPDDCKNRIPLVQAWGGEVASADGLRFVVPVRTLHAGPNPKYFGYEHGVTYYDLVSNQFTGLNAVVLPGTQRDSLFLLAVVLEQQTDLNPTEIMTDTGAYTDVVFGLFWLLGYRFSPRIADIGGARYWRVDTWRITVASMALDGIASIQISSGTTGMMCFVWPAH